MDIRVRSRGRLPHWTRPDSDYFITFRTAESISPEWLAALRITPWTPDEKRRLIEQSLDGCARGTILRDDAAECVASSILHGHQRDYHLRAWCVMPNHVHLLLRPARDARIAELLQSLKSITAHRINKLLGRCGPVWEREYFDRVVRAGKFETVKNYILRNPGSANLRNWEWVGSID